MSGTDVAVSNGVSTELALLDGEMRADIGAWRRDPDKRARYIALLDAKEAGTAAPAARSGGARRLGEIEALMRTPAGLAHYRKTPALRAEYLRLIEAGDGTAAPAAEPDAWRATPEQARTKLPATLVKEWDDSEVGFAASLRRMQDGLAQTLGGLKTVAEARTFLASVEALPVGVRIALCRETAMAKTGVMKWASPDEMEAFRSLSGGKETVAAWGHKAHRNVAISFVRFDRMFKSMAKSDQPAFTAWWRGSLNDRGRQLILWALGNG